MKKNEIDKITKMLKNNIIPAPLLHDRSKLEKYLKKFQKNDIKKMCNARFAGLSRLIRNNDINGAKMALNVINMCNVYNDIDINNNISIYHNIISIMMENYENWGGSKKPYILY